MGASSSTIKDTIHATFNRVDVGKKGYLTLKEVLRLPHIWGIDPGHLGVLFATDRDHNGLITLDEALSFAKHAAGLSRGLKARDTLTAGALTQGHCSLAMWRALQQPGGRRVFVEWVVQLITHGTEAAPAAGWDVPCVGAAAVKNLYQLFDMERRQGLLLEEFSGMLLSAAAEQGLQRVVEHEPSEASSGGAIEEGDSERDDGAASEGGGSEAAAGAASDTGCSSDGEARSSRGAVVGTEGGWGQQPQGSALGLSAEADRVPPASDGDPREARTPLPPVPLDVVEGFLDGAFDGMGGVVDSIVDASELAEALGDSGGAPEAAAAPPFALRMPALA